MENISAEECSFYSDLFGSKRKGAEKPTKNLINYLAVYGNTAGKNVDANSNLAAEFLQALVKNSVNIL